MIVLGVDIGGTKIAAAQVNERAELVREITVPTLAGEGFEASYRQLRTAIYRAVADNPSACSTNSPSRRANRAAGAPSTTSWSTEMAVRR